MVRQIVLGTLLASAAIAGAGGASANPYHHRHHRHHRAARPAAPYGYAYDAPRSRTPDCRYPDGTPFDPDIIGGENHVGDGGPAVNFGGFPRCGY